MYAFYKILLQANSAGRSAANNYAGYHSYVFQLPDFKARWTKTNLDDNWFLELILAKKFQIKKMATSSIVLTASVFVMFRINILTHCQVKS